MLPLSAVFARVASSTVRSTAAAHWCELAVGARTSLRRVWSPGGANGGKAKETGTEGPGRPSRGEGNYSCRPQHSRHSTRP